MVEVVAALINQSEQLLESLTKHGFNTQIIPYRKPGEELAEEVFQSMSSHPDCNLLCLENHGVVVFSDDIKEIESQIALLQKLCKKELFHINALPKQDVPQVIQNTEYKLLDDFQINSLVFSNEIYSQLNHLWPICPDHIVFLGPRPYLYDYVDDFSESMDSPYQPPLVFVKNTGIYIRKDIFTKIFHVY